MKYISLIISCGLTGAVFWMSSSTGTESSTLSYPIAEAVQRIIAVITPQIEIDILILQTIIRKSAHVFEYFLLGIAYAVTFHYFKLPLWSLVLAGLVIAFIDEGSQFLPAGRGPSIIDVIIYDFPGYLIGSLITKAIVQNHSHKINVS
ncbi:MAG: VanZ family protein [Candidatus Izemoplasmatales bacterium]|jgi:VanZ family protein